MEASGLRQEACEHAFELLGQPRRVPKPADAPSGPSRRDMRPAKLRGAGGDLRVHLAARAVHGNGGRAAADRAVGTRRRLGANQRGQDAGVAGRSPGRRADRPIAGQAKAEADYGYCGTFKFDEYNDPTPRWREAFVRALGLLGARAAHGPDRARILERRSVVAGRPLCGGQALGDLLADGDNRAATAALTEAAAGHTFESVRHLARDTLPEEGMRAAAVSPRHRSHRNRPARQSETEPIRSPASLRQSCFSRATT